MTMTDPIADMLARLRNANSAYHDTVSMPHSKIKANIAEILQAQGYIAGWHVEEATVGKTLTLDLKYGPSRERSIAGLRRVSKPGLRVYAKSTGLPRVLGGLGNMLGGFVAAFIIAQFITIGGSCFATEWGYAIAFLFFMVMIFIRPQGLFGGKA